ncbi:hypothetical protein [Gloeocapsa sp. PCC 7428]|nr:hypothetical protein [Gloeocapsa sp. PCC 7428]
MLLDLNGDRGRTIQMQRTVESCWCWVRGCLPLTLAVMPTIFNN